MDPEHINWESWKGKIATEGLVDKVKANYESLVSERYDVNKICDQVLGHNSEDLDNINRELAFHA